MSEKNLPAADTVVAGHYKGVYIPKLVEDIVLFGQGQIVEICDKHRVDDKLFAEIIELPFFKKEMREVRALAEASPHSLIQMKARSLVDQGLMYMHDIVKNGKDRDRIKAMEFLSKISGFLGPGGVSVDLDNGKPQASGLVLNVNLGPGGLIPPIPTGGHSSPYKSVVMAAEYEKITEKLDIQE